MALTVGKRFGRLIDNSSKRKLILVAIDIAFIAAVTCFYYFTSLRAHNSFPVRDTGAFFINAAIQCAAIICFRFAIGTYRTIWRYPNTKAYFYIVLADTCAGIITLVLLRFFLHRFYFGLWQAVTIGALSALVTLISRFCYSILYKQNRLIKRNVAKKPAAIVGAGRLGSYLVGDLKSNANSRYEPVFFVDTDATKIGNKVHDIIVLDSKRAESYIRTLGVRDVIITITSKNREGLSKLYGHYTALGCNVRICESLVSDETEPKPSLRDVSIEDLLFREPIKLDSAANSYYAGKTVLVTGGGGSIGSEICRQIACCKPRRLIIFDIYENNAYDIQQELIRTCGPALDLCVEIGSVRDAGRLDELFERYRPEVVFHAAAHKHVPLMEHCGAEAIKNNCLGTYNTANAAEKYGVERFILISTDKAVNPTNIMGASKRVCEMIVQCRTDSKTRFAAVRFGNVLGSNGSVIPLFRKQIDSGGPVTITDKRIIRYFMTISEASQLVIQAGAMARSGELFVLDMGNPVKVYDLAVNMIRLSGLEPDVDIEIKEIGLRPGEKLYEELLMKSERLAKTDNDLIFIERDTPYTREQVDEKLSILTQSCACGDIKAAVAAVVPTFREPDEVNKKAANANEMKLAKQA